MVSIQIIRDGQPRTVFAEGRDEAAKALAFLGCERDGDGRFVNEIVSVSGPAL